LATIVKTQGSGPQKAGNAALFGHQGLIAGTIGGGIVEHSVENISKSALKDRKSLLQRFHLNNDVASDEGAICGGSMEVLIDSNPVQNLDTFHQVAESLQKGIPGVLTTMVEPQPTNNLTIKRLWFTRSTREKIITEFTFPQVAEQIRNMLENNASQEFESITPISSHQGTTLQIFLNRITPPPHLIIAGAGHIGKALARLGKFLQFEVTVWDDREEFANRNNFPDADSILTGHCSQALGNLNASESTYIVIVTRGHQQDAEVMKLFIGSNARYVGMIGSRKKVAAMKKHFIENGWATTAEWNRIHAPIGIDIHSKTVEEIAVSIAAQLIQERNKPISHG